MNTGFGNGFSFSIGNDGYGSGFSRRARTSGHITSGLKLFLDAGNPESYPGYGSTWSDISGNGKHATLYNSPVYSPDSGGIISFSKNNYQYAEGAYLGGFSNWTTEAWINFSALPVAGTNAIVTDRYDLISKLNFSLGTNDAGSSNIKAGFYNSGWRNTTAGLAPTVGLWYHLVGTYDGSTVKIYSNENLISSLNHVGTAEGGGLGYRVARRWDDADNVANNFISANIPLIRVYDRALSLNEIKENFSSEKTRYGL